MGFETCLDNRKFCPIGIRSPVFLDCKKSLYGYCAQQLAVTMLCNVFTKCEGKKR